MSTLIVGDIHSGISNDDPFAVNNLLDTWEQIIEHCVKNNIKNIIQTGDWFDVRKGITQTTMNFNREVIVPMIEKAGLHCYVIIGNHDCQFKNTLFPNSVSEVLGKYKCFTVIEHPSTCNIDGVDIDLIPWMCEENTKEILDFISKTKSKYSVGHWELSGYYFYKNQKSTGFEPDFLKNYKIAISGHFHTKSEGGNVFYVGTPLTLTANDENEIRGFYEFNDGEFTFIPNKRMYHKKVVYPLDKDINFDDYKNTSTRLIVNEIDDEKEYRKFEDKLSSVCTVLRTIVNIRVEATLEDVDIENTSILDISLKYIDSLTNIDDNERQDIKDMFISLKNEVGM